MAPIDSLPLIKELDARRLIRFRILEEAHLTKRNSRMARLLSWLKRILKLNALIQYPLKSGRGSYPQRTRSFPYACFSGVTKLYRCNPWF